MRRCWCASSISRRPVDADYCGFWRVHRNGVGLQGYLVLTTYSAETSLGMLWRYRYCVNWGRWLPRCCLPACWFGANRRNRPDARYRATLSMEMMAVDPLRRVISPRFWAGLFHYHC